SALDATPGAWRTYVRTAYGALACCHLQRGELDQAERALSAIAHPDEQSNIHRPFLLEVRAQLRLAQIRPEEALEDALEAGRLLASEDAGASPGVIAWRSTAALAHLALGDRSRAAELAGEELAEARRLGITRVAIRDLRVLGLSERGERGLELLAE